MKIFNKKIEYQKGQLLYFPIEVIEAMLIEQEKQTGKKDVTIFQDFRITDAQQGGFTWKNTSMGFTFWDNIIRHKRFNLFFEKYKQ